MEFHFNKSDFDGSYTDPGNCAIAKALRRYGYQSCVYTDCIYLPIIFNKEYFAKEYEIRNVKLNNHIIQENGFGLKAFDKINAAFLFDSGISASFEII